MSYLLKHILQPKLHAHIFRNWIKYVPFLLAGFCFSLTVRATAQSAIKMVKYDLRVLNMNIGELTVKQQTGANDLIIDAITDVKVKILFTYEVRFLQHSLYRQGNLWSSHLQTFKNGQPNSDTWLSKKGETYLLIKDGDTTLIHDKITYSGSLIYFNEPTHDLFIYQEVDGGKKYLKYIGNQSFILTDNEGHKINKYVYKNGILDHAEIKHTLATIYMDRSTNVNNLQ
jgi:hypothetical protein